MSTERHDHPSDDRPGDVHGPGPAGAPDPASGDTPEQDPGHRDRPARRSRLTVAVVAAAVLLAGGGGAYWAASSSGGGGDDKAAQPLRFDGPVAATGSGGSATSPAGGDTYQLTGTLPDGPKSAPVYRAAGGPDQAAVQRLAGLLGLSGPVRSVQGSWQVGGTSDGGGPTLLVGKDAPGTWSYTRYGAPSGVMRPDGSDPAGSSSSRTSSPGSSGPGTSTSGKVTTGSASSVRVGTPGGAPGADTTGLVIDTVTGPTTTGGSGPVSVQKAQQVAGPVLSGLGLSGARTDASQTVGALRMVTADPVVGGLPTHGWATTLQVGADGALTMGYGRLSALTEGDSYPVVDAKAALKELNAQPVMRPDICAVPQPEPRVPRGPGAMSGDDKGGKPSPGPTLRDTRPCVPPAPHKVQVRGATFGLAMEFVSGTQTLVPAWLFDTAQAGVARTAVVAQTAVDPSYITGDGGATGAGPGTNAPGGPVPVSPATPVNPGGPNRVDPAQPIDPRAPRPVVLDRYTTSGRTLTVSFYGGVCPGYTASAEETGTEVRVHVTETPAAAGKMCPMIMRQLTRSVTLKEPLGARTVVDTANGQPIRGQ